MHKLYIKNMVCQRCIMAVQTELEKLGLQPAHIQLGEVKLADQPTSGQLSQLRQSLEKIGFEVLNDQKKQIIEKIKTTIINLVHHSGAPEKIKLSESLSASLHKDYSFLSNLFSEVEGITIEKYHINQKIERVKEMLIYNQQTLSEIAYLNGYSSVSHLSAQFKKVTGLTPGHFKTNGLNERRSIDSI